MELRVKIKENEYFWGGAVADGLGGHNLLFVAAGQTLKKEKYNAVGDQRDGDGDGVMQVCVKPIIQQDADDTRGDDGDDDVEPQRQGRFSLRRRFLSRKGIETLPKENEDGKDRAELNDD